MTIPTQMSLAGYIVGPLDRSSTRDGDPHLRVRVGVEHFRKETDGTFTTLDSTYHDLVMFGPSADKAAERFRPGDYFVASGYIHEYEVTHNDTTIPKEQFVARRIGHDTTRTNYEVSRKHPTPPEPVPAVVATPAAALGL